jgi:sec-independent protein translocase protein TatA
MLGSLGMPELIVIFVIALIIFGPRKLPELGRSLGKSLAEFKRASNELRSTLEEEIRVEDQKARVEPVKASDVAATVPATHSDEPAIVAGAPGKVDKSA